MAILHSPGMQLIKVTNKGLFPIAGKNLIDDRAERSADTQFIIKYNSILRKKNCKEILHFSILTKSL